MRLWRVLIGLCLLSPCAGAAAQTVIHRCMGANGTPVFTDRACSDLQAIPRQPPPRTPASAPAGGSGAPPPILCAANFAQLKQAVIDAFALGDANRLAGLMLWEGEGHGAAVADIRALHALMQHPLVEVGPDAAGDPVLAEADTAASAPAVADPPELRVLTAAADGSGVPHETRFPVVRQSGCLWLRQP
jgi:hypothetical protein